MSKQTYTVWREGARDKKVKADSVSFEGGVAVFYEKKSNGMVSNSDELVVAVANWDEIRPE